MVERETILPLSIGAVLALAAHVVLLPAMADSLREGTPRAEKALPDLAIDSFEAPTQIEPGTSFTFRLAVANKRQADVPVDAHWIDGVYLSADEVLSTDDIELFSSAHTEGEFRDSASTDAIVHRHDGRVTLPGNLAGKMFLIAATDVKNEVAEASEENNTLAVPIEITSEAVPASLPDLLIEDANAPNVARVGESLTIQFRAANRGKTAAGSSQWNDAVLLSRDEKPDASDALIAIEPGPAAVLTGETYDRRITGPVKLPQGAAGAMFLLVIADYGNAIAESDEANNVFVLPITIEARARPADEPKQQATGPQGPPDLQIPAVSVPPRAMNGETLKVDFLVANRGEGPTSEPLWRDRVYLSDDETIDERDLLLANVERQGSLPVGGHYPVQIIGKIDLPEDKAGRMYVIIHTDALGDVAESNEINNTRIVPIEIEQIVLGKDDSDAKLAVAWIAHDDFAKLIAPQSQTEQPAIQDKVDPVPNASTPRDPSPPSPTAPRPQPVTQATPAPETPNLKPAPPRPDPSEDIGKPARLVEAQSPLNEPSPRALESPKAEAPATLPLPPRPQVPAEGPRSKGEPVTQPPAETAKPKTQGAPVTQEQATLPEPIAPEVNPQALAAATKGIDVESRDPANTPMPTEKVDPLKQPRAETPVPVQGNPAKLVPSEAPPSRIGEPTKSIPATTPDPKDDGKLATSKPLEGEEDMPKPSPASEQKGEARPTSEDKVTKKPVPPMQPANPTSAPRAESRVPPTILEDKQLRVTPGGVIVREGIQIIASTPDITITSWLVSGPTVVNPIASITFNRDGKVISVVMIRESGHANIDSPVKSAFFSFRAKGKALEKVRDTFTIEIKLLLKPEPNDE
ncbi:MAG: CARDB domain-containing protein [Phycisphaeraceae bacterium]